MQPAVCWRFVRLVGVAILIAPGFAEATTYNWTGAGPAPKNYLDAANWSPGGVPGNGDTAVFSANDSVTFFSNVGVDWATVAGASLTITQSGGDRLWGISNVLRTEDTATLSISGGLDVTAASLVVHNDAPIIARRWDMPRIRRWA